MANYKEANINGSAYQRCHTVTIHNQLNSSPTVEFQEEKILSIDGQQINQWVGQCSKVFNPTDSIPLLDLASSAPTGETITHAKLYQILYSLYMQTAKARDLT